MNQSDMKVKIYRDKYKSPDVKWVEYTVGEIAEKLYAIFVAEGEDSLEVEMHPDDWSEIRSNMHKIAEVLDDNKVIE